MGIDYIELYFTRRQEMTEIEKLLVSAGLFMSLAFVLLLIASVLKIFGM